MDEMKENMIHLKANDIRNRVEGGKIYGELVNIYDIDFMVVAAYYLGLSDGMPSLIKLSDIKES